MSTTSRDWARLALPICLLMSVHELVESKDISSCCTQIRIASTGEAINHQSNRVGDYSLSGVLSDRPIYKHEEREEFLFYLTSRNKGLWMVGPKAAQFNGGLAHRGDALCVEDVAKEEWKYTDGSTWNVDPQLTVSCLDKKAKAKCTYNDGVQFVGGDLPSEFGGGGLQTNINSSAQCIEECEKRTGCQYWTWVQEQGPNCFLKVDKVESVRRPKYVSGSLPSACIQDEDEEQEVSEELSVCTHKGVEFVGGDLFKVAAAGVADCRQQCAEQASCQLFSYVADEVIGCYLKTEAVRAKVSSNVVSGAIASICEEFVLPHVSAEESSVYNPNEINGKFKIMMDFREELNNPESKEFNELAGTLEKYLLDMLVSEPEFNEQATFDVRVESFRPGSVVCNFKVNYILKEAYLAVPFAIKPSNITDSMNKNFKYKKGILFQRFLIAAGSFKSAAPVDHCQVKGCSHKCNYDYDIEDYVCTCPPALTLGPDAKTCLDPNEIPEEDADTVDGELTTVQPEVVVALLPSDCLWSNWSEWSTCSCTTNLSTRSRNIAIPAKNGGACSGTYEEEEECVPNAAICAAEAAAAEATTVTEDILEERTEVPVDESADDSTTQGYPEEDDTTEQIDDVTTQPGDAAADDATEASGESTDDNTTEGSAEYDGEFGDKISPTTEESPVTSTEAIYDDDVESSGDYATTVSPGDVETTVDTLIEDDSETPNTEELAVEGVVAEDDDATTVASMDDGEEATATDEITTANYPEEIDDADSETTTEMAQEEADEEAEETTKLLFNEDGTYDVVTVPAVELTTEASGEEATEMPVSEDGETDDSATEDDVTEGSAAGSDATEMPASKDVETEESVTGADATEMPASEDDSETDDSATESVPAANTEMAGAEDNMSTTVASVESADESATGEDTVYPSGRSDTTIFPVTETMPSKDESGETTVAPAEEDSEDAMDVTTQSPMQCEGAECDIESVPAAGTADCGGYACDVGDSTTEIPEATQCEGPDCNTFESVVDAEQTSECGESECQTEVAPKQAGCEGSQCDAEEVPSNVADAAQCSEGSDCAVEVSTDAVQVDEEATTMEPEQIADDMDDNVDEDDQMTTQEPSEFVDEEIFAKTEGTLDEENVDMKDDVVEGTTNYPAADETTEAAVDTDSDDTDKETTPSPNVEYTDSNAGVDGTTPEADMNVDDSETTTATSTVEEEMTETSIVGADMSTEQTENTDQEITTDSTGEESVKDTSDEITTVAYPSEEAEADVDSTTVPAESADDTEDDTPIVFPINDDDIMFTTTLRSADSETEEDAATEDAVDGVIDQVYVETTTTAEILEVTEPEKEDPEVLSQTKDDDASGTTDTPRSFPDNAEIHTNAVETADDEEMTTLASTDETVSDEVVAISEDVDQATESVDEAIESVDKTTESVDEATESVDEATESIDEATESIDRAAESVEEATEPVDEATESADEATEPVDEAAESIDEATESIDRAAESVEEATESVDETTESANEAIDLSDEATENIPVTTDADAENVDDESTTVAAIDESDETTVSSLSEDESDETTLSSSSEDEVEARTESDAQEISPTMVTVVAVEESEDTTVVITTMRPEVDTELDDVTTESPAEEDTGLHEFECVEVDEGDLGASADQIPMECTQMDGEEKRKLYIVINKSQVDAEKLFAKNVKVVVKDFMVMDISNQSQVR